MEILINKISKEYKNKYRAIDHLSLELKPGIFGLLGPNGAGKTSLIKCLTQLEKVSSGEIIFEENNKKIEDIRPLLGYVPQYFGLPENLTGLEFLLYMSAAKGLSKKDSLKRSNDLLALLNLVTVSNQQISSYSGGMKQRLGIAQALLNDPKLLILDEPTVGLDPDERLHFKKILADISETTVILLSTHIVSDIESVANQLAILSNGQLRANGSTQDLLEEIKPYIWEKTISDDEIKDFETNYLVSYRYHATDCNYVRFLCNKKISGAVQSHPTLEDAYLYYTNKEPFHLEVGVQHD